MMIPIATLRIPLLQQMSEGYRAEPWSKPGSILSCHPGARQGLKSAARIPRLNSTPRFFSEGDPPLFHHITLAEQIADMKHKQCAFSLVEVLAAVAIIGVITFLALPNIIAVKQDSETNLAISRAEAMNLALVSYIQSYGRTNATNNWEAQPSDQMRYALLASYLAFAPAQISDYMPSGYSISLPVHIETLSKMPLSGPGGTIFY